MPNLYARQTALTNVGGRIDYISNPDRQEHLLAVHDGAADLAAGAYWRQLAQECKAASKHAAAGRKSVQGRELTIQLSNALLRRMTPEQIAEKLARSFEEKYHRPCMVAVHFNKTKTNLHAHLIYSERELLKEPEEKIAPRALFFDEEGKRHYKKAEILDDAGELRPGCRIVKKGEVYDRRCFSSVDQTFSSKGWLRLAKKEWLLPLRNGELRGDVEITEYSKASGKLAQQHVGKVKDTDSQTAKEKAARIQAYNKSVREYNRLVDADLIPASVADLIQEKVMATPAQPARNSLLQQLMDWIQTFLKKWYLDLEQKNGERSGQKLPLERKIQLSRERSSLEPAWKQSMQFVSRLDWRLQEQLDKACGTGYAAEAKTKYFTGQRGEFSR